MKQCIALILSILILIGLCACSAPSLQPDPSDLVPDSGTPQEPAVMQVRFALQCECPLRSLAVNYYLHDQLLGTLCVEHADHTPLGRETVTAEFLENDYKSALTGDQDILTLQISVSPVDSDTYVLLPQIVTVPAQIGRGYTVTVTGTSAEDLVLSSSDASVTAVSLFEAAGSWIVDPARNNLSALTSAFAGYGEFGASMKLSDDGSAVWYIGALGGSGTWSQSGNTVTITYTEDISGETKAVVCSLLQDQDANAVLMDCGDMQVYWIYADSPVSEDVPVSHPGPEMAKIVNARGDIVVVKKQEDGTYVDAASHVFTYNGAGAWTDRNGVQWDESLQ